MSLDRLGPDSMGRPMPSGPAHEASVCHRQIRAQNSPCKLPQHPRCLSNAGKNIEMAVQHTIASLLSRMLVFHLENRKARVSSHKIEPATPLPSGRLGRRYTAQTRLSQVIADEVSHIPNGAMPVKGCTMHCTEISHSSACQEMDTAE